MTPFSSLLIATAILVAYGLFSMRLQSAIHPIRVRVAHEIETWIALENVPDDVKRDLDEMGKHLFSKWAAWVIVISFLPIVAKSVVSKLIGIKNPSWSHPRKPAILHTFAQGVLCTIASSPICLLIFVVEFFLSVLVASPIRLARIVVHTTSQLMLVNQLRRN
ncbi:MAG: hypothetical protein GYB24_15745 [Rhodobacteraceae bacterium]|nr:hypothetical protein [Paracoccaceae bacterium]